MNITEQKIREELVLAGSHRAETERERKAASRALAAGIRKAHKAGMTPTDIALQADVSRQTVHTILKER